MDFKKFRWSVVYESSEEELISLLQARGLNGERVHLEADTETGGQYAETTVTIWCAEGSAIVQVGAQSVSMQTGDALRIETGMTYLVQPGITGCAYYLTT